MPSECWFSACENEPVGKVEHEDSDRVVDACETCADIATSMGWQSADRTECWQCGHDRLTWEACSECGALGSEEPDDDLRADGGRPADGVERPTLSEFVDGREWPMLKMAARVARQNREKLWSEWCIVCGRAAAEDHSARFHAAGGCLAGPFCSQTCAFLWLKDDRVSEGEYPREHVRESYRHDCELEHFENASTAEEFCGLRLFPSIEGHDWTGVSCDA